MDIYHYHPVTGEYLGTSKADESPREPGVFVIPGCATATAPPAPAEGNRIVFSNGAWGYVHVELPEEPPAEEPVELTPEQKRERLPALPSRQFWLGALSIGITEETLTATVTAQVADEFERNGLLTEIRKATEFERLSTTVLELSELENIPAEQLDDLWIWSSSL